MESSIKLRPYSMVLFNESFASTNEREGSEIARQIVRALMEREVKVFYVTHMFDLAEGFYRLKMDAALFLRAERLGDGQRTFRLIDGRTAADKLWRGLVSPHFRLGLPMHRLGRGTRAITCKTTPIPG